MTWHAGRAHTGTRAAEAGFELHVRRDDARGQLAAFFTAPPHDVLASRFSLQLVCGEREGANATTGTRRLERAAANRVHFFSLKSEQGGGSCDDLAHAGDLWLQLLVERPGASARGPAEVVAAVFAGTASPPQQPCTRQKQTPADESNLAEAPRRNEQRAAGGTTSTGSAARRRRSLRELRQFAQRVCAFWVSLCLSACVVYVRVCAGTKVSSHTSMCKHLRTHAVCPAEGRLAAGSGRAAAARLAPLARSHKQEASEQLSYDKVTGDDAAIYCRNNGDKPGTDAAFLRQDTLGDPAHCAQEDR